MLATAMRTMPLAATSVGRPSGRATRSASARRAASASSGRSPPMKLAASRRPRTRLASVTVGSTPPRLGARALRADVDAARLVHPGERAAPGAHLVDVDGGDADGQALVVAADEEVVGQPRHAALDYRRLGGRAAHIEADGVGDV